MVPIQTPGDSNHKQEEENLGIHMNIHGAQEDGGEVCRDQMELKVDNRRTLHVIALVVHEPQKTYHRTRAGSHEVMYRKESMRTVPR